MTHSVLLPLVVAAVCFIAAGLLSTQRRVTLASSHDTPGPNAAPWLRFTGLAALAATILWLPAGPVQWTAGGASALAVLVAAASVWQDIAARIIVWLDGSARQGTLLTSADTRGVIQKLSLRKTRLLTPEGNVVWIPNRALLREHTSLSPPGPWEIVVLIVAPEDMHTQLIDDALMNAAQVAPWRALDTSPQVTRDPSRPTHWTVKLKLIDRKYEPQVVQALVRAVRHRAREDTVTTS